MLGRLACSRHTGVTGTNSANASLFLYFVERLNVVAFSASQK